MLVQVDRKYTHGLKTQSCSICSITEVVFEQFLKNMQHKCLVSRSAWAGRPAGRKLKSKQARPGCKWNYAPKFAYETSNYEQVMYAI